MHAVDIFSGRADDYSKGRPGYAEGFIDYLYSSHGFSQESVIADIGSGTGKFARNLLIRGSEVFCVEPNTDMRLTAEKELKGYPGFVSVNGNAEKTTLKSSSVDHIVSAQAFHWFDTEAFKKECVRILTPDGKVFLIWNTRKEDDINNSLKEIYSRYCPSFRGFSGGTKPHDERIRCFFNDKYEFVSFENPIYQDKETFILRSLSASYSLKKDDCEYNHYINALSTLFKNFAVRGKIKIENATVAYIGTID